MLHASRDVVFDERDSLYTKEPSIDMVEEAMTKIALAGVDHQILTAQITQKLADQLARRLADRLTDQLVGVETSKKT